MELDLNTRWAFRCLGADQAPGQEFWLDGNTTTGIVGLAPSPTDPFTGTKWRAVFLDGGGSYGLQCLGKDTNPQHIFLDGHVGDQSFNPVKLAPGTDGVFTGTHWVIQEFVLLAPPQILAVSLTCLGSGDGPRILDGVTASRNPSQRRVKLSPSSADPFTGTKWQLVSFGAVGSG